MTSDGASQDALFSRLTRNYGFFSAAEQRAICKSTVALAGVGGDGYLLGLGLVRMGVRHLTIADPEVFEAENINRVPGANFANLGRAKVDCFVEDAREIDPDVAIRVFSEGVTERNIGEFLDGADLIVDETELTKLELGTMISDEAQKRDQPIVIVMNIGFAAQVTALSPKGPGFREMMDIPSTEPLAEVARRQVDFARCIPYIPPYVHIGVLESVIAGASLPSIVHGVNLASALGASQCFLWLTRGVESERPKPITYPQVQYVDALTGESKRVRNVQRSYAKSLIRMKLSQSFGRTPKVQYPVSEM